MFLHIGEDENYLHLQRREAQVLLRRSPRNLNLENEGERKGQEKKEEDEKGGGNGVRWNGQNIQNFSFVKRHLSSGARASTE